MEDENEVKMILRTLLVDSYYSKFQGSTRGFRLYFEKYQKEELNGFKVTSTIEIWIYSSWWLNSLDEWIEKQKKYRNDNIVEPYFPLLAYELASLMWMNDSKISDIELTNEKMVIQFKNGEYISLLNKVDMDYAWELIGIDENSTVVWNVTCDSDGELYAQRSS